jgi:hypothetical protein
MCVQIDHACPVEEYDDWKRLVETLDAWTSAAERAPGQIEVSVHQGGTSRDVVIVMTPDEWDDMAGVMRGDFDDAVEEVKRTLLDLQSHERFAVYSQYRLEPSTQPTLREPPDLTPEPAGEWVAYDREGRIASRFADWSEPDEQS